MLVEFLPFDSFLRIDCYHSLDELFDGLLHLCVTINSKFNRGRSDYLHHLLKCLAIQDKRESAFDHVVEDYSQRPHIRSDTILLSCKYFRSHVRISSQARIQEILGGFQDSRETQIPDFEAVGTAKDILGFEISVDNVVTLKLLQTTSQLPQNDQCFFLSEAAARLCDVDCQSGLVAEFHDDCLVVSGVEEIVDLDHGVAVTESHGRNFTLQKSQAVLGRFLCLMRSALQ